LKPNPPPFLFFPSTCCVRSVHSFSAALDLGPQSRMSVKSAPVLLAPRYRSTFSLLYPLCEYAIGISIKTASGVSPMNGECSFPLSATDRFFQRRAHSNLWTSYTLEVFDGFFLLSGRFAFALSPFFFAPGGGCRIRIFSKRVFVFRLAFPSDRMVSALCFPFAPPLSHAFSDSLCGR